MTGQPISEDAMRMQILMQLAKNTEMIVQALQSTTTLSVQQATLFKSIIGNNNIINVAVNSVVTISAQQFNALPAELNHALQLFAGEFNKQVQCNKIPQAEVTPIQQDLTDLGKEAEGVNPSKVDSTQKVGIKAKLMKIAKRIYKHLPDTAETILLCTPLAPFAKVIGTTIADIMGEVKKE